MIKLEARKSGQGAIRRAQEAALAALDYAELYRVTKVFHDTGVVTEKGAPLEATEPKDFDRCVAEWKERNERKRIEEAGKAVGDVPQG